MTAQLSLLDSDPRKAKPARAPRPSRKTINVVNRRNAVGAMLYAPKPAPVMIPGYPDGIAVKYWADGLSAGLDSVTLAPPWYNEAGEWMVAITMLTGDAAWVPAWKVRRADGIGVVVR